MQQLWQQWRFALGCGILLIAVHALAAPIPRSVSYQLKSTRQARVHVITVDLADQRLQVTPALAYGVPGRRQSFARFLATQRPFAQMTGAYFGLRNGFPVGDIVVDTRMCFDGFVGSALAIRPGNRAEMIDIPYRHGASWQGYESVIQGGIRLLNNGHNVLSPRDQGFRDPGLFRHAARTGVGITAHHKLLFVALTRGVLLSQFRDIMKSLGCQDAMTLDGGASTGLAFGSHIIIAPGRPLSNVLIVKQRPAPPQPPAPAAEAAPAEEIQ